MEQSRLSAARLGITAAAMSGDAGALYRLAAGLLDDGVPFDVILFDVLLHSERDIGLRWQAGDYLVSEEHAATAAVETVISLLAGAFDQPDRGPHIVVATAEGDNHSLPGRAVAAYLLHLGYRTTYLGASVLASDLREFLDSEAPTALVLSCAMTTHLLGARAAIRESHAARVPVVAGGRGFGDAGVWATPLGADAWTPSGRGVADVLAGWAPDPVTAEIHAHDPDATLQAVIDQSTAILATAEARLANMLGTPPGPRLRHETAIALDAVQASLLVGDRALMEEFFAWQRDTLAAHGLDHVPAMIECLSAAVGAVVPGLTGWITATED